MKLRFEIPEDGWTKLQVIDENNTYTQIVSDVPLDSFSNLVCAIQNILNGSNIETVEWSLEPDYEKWEFIKNESNLRLIIYSTANSNAVFECEESVERMVLSIYRGLRGLESLDVWKDIPNKAWSWDFPSQGLENIKLKIKAIA